MAGTRTRGLILTGFLLCLAVERALATCYYPNGDEAPDVRCSDDHESMCCGQGYACLSNGMCLGTDAIENSDYVGMLIRGSCTDQSWDDSHCASFCIDPDVDNVDGAETVYQCDSNQQYYYCANDEEHDCDDEDTLTYLAGTNPSTITVIGVVSTSTSSSSSSSASKEEETSASITEAVGTPQQIISTEAASTTSAAPVAPETTASPEHTSTAAESGVPETSAESTSVSRTAAAAGGDESSNPDSSSGAALTDSSDQASESSAQDSQGGPDESDDSSSSTLAIGVGVGVGVGASILLAAAGLAFWLRRRHSRDHSSESPEPQTLYSRTADGSDKYAGHGSPRPTPLSNATPPVSTPDQTVSPGPYPPRAYSMSPDRQMLESSRGSSLGFGHAGQHHEVSGDGVGAAHLGGSYSELDSRSPGVASGPQHHEMDSSVAGQLHEMDGSSNRHELGH